MDKIIEVLNNLIIEGCYPYFYNGVEINGMLIPLKNNKIDINKLTTLQIDDLKTYYKSIENYL